MSKDSKLTLIIVSVIALVILVVGGAFVLYSPNQASVYLGTASDNPDKNTQPSDKDANGCYTPETVRKHYDETACVDFRVGYTYESSGGTKFIDEKQDYQSGFVVYIPYNSTFSSVDLSQFDGKQIKVSGLIKAYRGYPEIEADDYSQVEIYQ